MCDHLDDPFIQELLYEFKSDGYLVYFGTISLICKENKYDNVTGQAVFHGRFLKEKFHVSVTKLQQIYNFCQTKGKLSFNFSEKNFDFDFPKIKEIKDYTSSNYQATPKKLDPIEVEGLRVKGEVDKSKHIVSDPVLENFNQDWSTYPRKAGNKKKALSCYKKSIGNNPEKRKQFLGKMQTYIQATDPEFLQFGETFFRNWESLEVDTMKSRQNGRSQPTPMTQALDSRGKFVDKVTDKANALFTDNRKLRRSEVADLVIKELPNAERKAAGLILYNFMWLEKPPSGVRLEPS